MPKAIDGNKQILYSGYGSGLTQKQKNAVNIIQTPFIDIGQTWGAGAIGTGEAPIAFRQTDAINGLIITEVQIDLTGFTMRGGDAGDVIGKGVKPAFIYKNEVANNGIIFKHELICTELPASSTGTISTDINVAWNSSATIDFDEAGGTASQIDSGHLVAGQIVVDNTAAITANHYAYLTEGDTAANGGTFTSGQLIYRMYGYKVR